MYDLVYLVLLFTNLLIPFRCSQDDIVSIFNFFSKEIIGVGVQSHVASLISLLRLHP